MIIICPQCGKKFNVKEQALKAPSCKVRCKECSHVWRVGVDGKPFNMASSENRPKSKPIPKPKSKPKPKPSTDMDYDPASIEKSELTGMSVIEGLRQRESLAAHGDKDEAPEILKTAKREDTFKVSRSSNLRHLIISWVGFLLFVVVCVSVFIFGRVPLLKNLPYLTVVYELVGLPTLAEEFGLEIVDLRISNGTENEVDFLLVSGAILNNSNKARRIPEIQIDLLGKYGEEIYSWSVQIEQEEVSSELKVPFESRLISPPEDAVGIKAKFYLPDSY